MAIGGATTDIAAVELEKVQDMIPALLKDETTLDGVIQDNGRSTRIGTNNPAFRVVLKFARPGAYIAGALDGAALPTGKVSQYDKFTLTPQIIMLPVGWTKLVELVGQKTDAIAIANIVEETMADAADQLKIIRNQLLQTDGTGTLAKVSSATGTVVTCQQASFGARLISPGQPVSFFVGTTLYGTAIVGNKVFNQIGVTQSFDFTNFVGANGHVVGDINSNTVLVRASGVADGAPVFIHGLPYVNNTSTGGSYWSITRANAPYVVAPGYDLGGAQVSLPSFRLLLTMIKSRLGVKALKGNGLGWHTHSSQIAAYEELGFEKQVITLADGKAKGMDLLFSGPMKVADHGIMENIDADQTRWDFIHPKCWGKVTYGDGPFWYEIPGIGRIYPLYSATGAPLTEFGATMVDAKDYYNDNPLAGGALTTARIPAGN